MLALLVIFSLSFSYITKKVRALTKKLLSFFSHATSAEEVIRNVKNFSMARKWPVRCLWKCLPGTCQGLAGDLSGTCRGLVRDLPGTCQGLAGDLSGTCQGLAGDLSGTCQGLAADLSGDLPGTCHGLAGRTSCSDIEHDAVNSR